MSTRHTPGSWIAAISETWPHGHPERAEMALNIHGGDGQEGYDGNIICLIAKQGRITKQDEANARLIAAAPELLAALKLLMDGCRQAQANGLNQPQINGGMILAHAAITKAERKEIEQ